MAIIRCGVGPDVTLWTFDHTYWGIHPSVTTCVTQCNTNPPTYEKIAHCTRRSITGLQRPASACMMWSESLFPQNPFASLIIMLSELGLIDTTKGADLDHLPRTSLTRCVADESCLL